MMPTVDYHAGYWWEQIATRKTKRAAERIYGHFANAHQPHRVTMSRFLCPNCGEREYAVWLELRPMEPPSHFSPRVAHHVN